MSKCKIQLFRWFFLFPLWGVGGLVHAQLNDAQWMLGPRTSNIDFRGTTPVSDTMQRSMGTRFSNSAISDEQGNILYYTNGVWIAGKLSDGDSILNGNELNPSPFTTQHNDWGLPIPQASIFLNKPDDMQNRYYYLIHFTGDRNNGVCYTLFSSLIDMQGNFGKGEVVSKNDTVYQDWFRSGGIAACKHANGRDWWVVVPKRVSNGYYKFLLTPDGITDTSLQYIGATYPNTALDQSYSRFSLDGTKYVTSAFAGLITVMDFNRCTGEFSNARTINNAEQGVGNGALVEFSSNGRFVYATNSLKLEQYDLDNPNIQDSVLVYRCGCPDGAKIHLLSLAYDGRIYGSTRSAGFRFLHVINSPDELGLDCNFVYGGQPTLSLYSWNISNTANPRLGALAGSGCDTIKTASPQTPEGGLKDKIRIQPNPADKAFYIEMPQQGNYVFELINTAGQVVERRETKQVDIINVQGVDNGAYILRVTSPPTPGGGLRQVAAKKVIVQH